MTTLFQIYYREDQKAKMYPFAVPLYNENLTIFFENDVINRIVPNYLGEKLAVCSWKLSQKVRNVHPVTREVLNSSYEVLSLTRNSRHHRMLAMANQWHPGFIPTIDLLWSKLGFKRPPEAKNPIYQNHFAATYKIYMDYVTNFLSPAIHLVNTDEELRWMMLQPSGYGKLSRSSDMKAVKAKLGLDDYPLCPFVFERCPSLWFTMKNIKVSYIP